MTTSARPGRPVLKRHHLREVVASRATRWASGRTPDRSTTARRQHARRGAQPCPRRASRSRASPASPAVVDVEADRVERGRAASPTRVTTSASWLRVRRRAARRRDQRQRDRSTAAPQLSLDTLPPHAGWASAHPGRTRLRARLSLSGPAAACGPRPRSPTGVPRRPAVSMRTPRWLRSRGARRAVASHSSPSTP